MDNDELISIALCTYNGEKYLATQLNSILEQSYQNIELVIVDDGSNDGTIATLQQYAKTDQRVKLYKNDQNLGYVKNFEKAIGLCSGNLICLSDQDDIWHKDKVKLMYENIGDNMLVYHDSAYIDENGQPRHSKISDYLNMYNGHGVLPLLFFNCVSGHCMMFKKELMNLTGAFDANIHHDWLLVAAAAYYGNIKYVDIPLVYYRLHHNSVIQQLTHENRKKDQEKRIYREINPAWIRKLAEIIPDKKHLVHEILYLINNRSGINRLKLTLLLYKYQQPLFSLLKRKKNKISRLNYVRKIAFNGTSEDIG